jgi:hypothetical protein
MLSGFIFQALVGPLKYLFSEQGESCKSRKVMHSKNFESWKKRGKLDKRRRKREKHSIFSNKNIILLSQNKNVTI